MRNSRFGAGLVLVSVALVGGCTRHWTAADRAEANSAEALAYAQDVDRRMAELEDRQNDLEARLDQAEARR